MVNFHHIVQETPWGGGTNLLYPDPGAAPAFEISYGFDKPAKWKSEVGMCLWEYDFHTTIGGQPARKMAKGEALQYRLVLTAWSPDNAKQRFENTRLLESAAQDTTRYIVFDPAGGPFTTTTLQDPSSTMVWVGNAEFALDDEVRREGRPTLRITGQAGLANGWGWGNSSFNQFFHYAVFADPGWRRPGRGLGLFRDRSQDASEGRSSMWYRTLLMVWVLAGPHVSAGAQASEAGVAQGQQGGVETARPGGANLSAADYPGIQAALDSLPPSGGRVFIPPGTYVLTGSLRPRDNVTIAGAGPATVLRACDLVAAKTTSPIHVGDTQVAVDNPAGFRVGMDVFAHKNIEWAPGVERAFSYTITGIDGKTLKFDKPAAFAQPVGAAVCTGAPVILVFRKRNVVIEHLTVDGNRKPDWVYVNLKMAGVYLWGTSDCTVQNCQVVNASGDGISAQFPPTGYSGSAAEGPMGWATAEKHEGNGTQILNNRVRGAAGFGIHLGGGQTKTIVKGNIVDACGWDGFYWCWDNSFTIVSDNIFTRNGWNGIGGYGDGSAVVSDTQNINSNNLCAYNGYAGIAVTGGSGNIMSGNVCFANSRAARGVHPGIKISIPQPDPKKAGQTYNINLVVTGNSCNDVGDKATQKCGIEVAANVRGVIVRDNHGSGNLGADVIPDTSARGK